MAAHLTAAEAQTVQKDPPPVPSFEPPALDLKDLEDASSCFEANTFAIRHAVFDWRIDFDKKTIEGSCTLMTERCPGSQATKLTLDAHSAMTGYELVAAKVNTVVFMDGGYNFGPHTSTRSTEAGASNQK